MFAEVLLEVSIRKPLDYVVPPELISKIAPGCWVEVPLRNRLSRGYVVQLKEHSKVDSPLPLTRLLSDGPIITEDLFQLALFMARYYATPIEKVLRSMLPSGVRKSVSLKRQYLVSRAKTRAELSAVYQELQGKAPQQAKLVEILLTAKGGVLLSELLEEAGAQASSVKALEEKGIVTLSLVRTGESLLVGESYFRTAPKPLRPEQEKALSTICSSLEEGSFTVTLLHGVTGSGKTEVYMQAMQAALAQGKGVLMLVPEIALTTQTIQRLKSRFEQPVAVLHHRLSDGERHEAWNDIRKGVRRIVIGARSAIFSPIPKLGLIIIDEEHEHSYKQTDDTPTYHARDIGIMRGKLCNAAVVLGSATPALESYQNALSGKYKLVTLKERSESAKLPTVHIWDMRPEFAKAKGITLFSDCLLHKIDERMRRGEQTLLFLNRRGFHTTTTCMQCHTVLKCPHCDVTLTFHKSENILSCHLCGYDLAPPKVCPVCKTASMICYRGIGTEKVEAALHVIFPEVRTLRADADTTRHKGALERILHAFRTGKADVMVGTQMMAKGLHFPEVTLVGVLNSDASLNIPDFRAQETVFQLITQVAGRAGRGISPGEVVLQTCLPDHPTIQTASKQDYEAYFAEEIALRRMFGFPPFSHMVKFVFSGPVLEEVQAAAGAWNQAFIAQLPSQFTCHPPLPCGHPKLKDHWRYQLLIRGPSVMGITSIAETLDKKIKLPPSVHRFCDVDPMSTFF